MRAMRGTMIAKASPTPIGANILKNVLIDFNLNCCTRGDDQISCIANPSKFYSGNYVLEDFFLDKQNFSLLTNFIKH